MKRVVLVLVILMSVTVFATAQSSTFFGVKGGWLNSGFIGEDASSQDQKSGFNAGFFLNVTAANGIIGFQPEVLFSQKGSTIQAGNIREDYELNYVDIPVLMKLSLPLDVLRPNVFVGPYASFKVSETYTYTETVTDFSTQSEGNTKDFDYGAVFGGGLDIHLDNIILSVDGRYNLGLQELEKVEEPKDIKNGSFGLNIGVGFRF